MSVHFHDKENVKSCWSLPWGGWGRTAAGSSGTSEGGRRYGPRSGGRVGTGLCPPCPSGPSLCRPYTPNVDLFRHINMRFVICIWIHSYLRASMEISWGMLRCKKNNCSWTPHTSDSQSTFRLSWLMSSSSWQWERLKNSSSLVTWGHNSTEKDTLTTGCAHFSPFFPARCNPTLRLTSLKCVLMYSRLRWCSSVQPISSAKRAMPMTLAGSRCLVRKSQHALATSSTWYLVENNRKGRKKFTDLRF